MAGSRSDNDEEIKPHDYMLLHDRCAICHWPSGRSGRWMELHHIVGGPGRKHRPFNFLSTCCRCHHAIHNKIAGYELPRGAVLTAKREEDGKCDPKQLASLLRRADLSYSFEPIPKAFLDDRRRRGGDPWP